MHIITVLDVQTNEVNIIDCFNDGLNAQNSYMDKIEELSKHDDDTNKFEPVFVTKTKCNIYYKYNGWTGHYKSLAKIVTLHEVEEYSICDV